MSTSRFEVYEVYTGEEFNQIASKYDMKFYKFTCTNEVHNGFQFKDGLNVDTVKFNPSGNCSAGGMYFTDKEHIKNWAYLHTFVRDVTIPDDARVYIEYAQYKADKFILGPRKRIYDDYDVISVLRQHWSSYQLRMMNPELMTRLIADKPYLTNRFANKYSVMKSMIKHLPKEFADINITFRITASK